MAEFGRDWFTGIDNMQREMERLLDRIASCKPPTIHFSPRVWGPSVDIYETEEAVVVLIELAGVREEEVEVTVAGNNLVVRGERRDPPMAGRGVCHQLEIARGPFERAVLLPAAVEADKSSASYGDGLLRINLPKVKREQTLRVRIRDV